jgi:hypothetical protein
MRTTTAVAGNRVSMVRAGLPKGVKVSVRYSDGEKVNLADASDLFVVDQSPPVGAEVDDDVELVLVVGRPAS